MRAYIDHVESFDDLARAAMASPASDDLRRLSMPDRLAAFRQFADSIEPSPPEADRERIARLLVVLTASSALRMWRDHLGASVDEVADDIDWVVRAAIAAATAEDAAMSAPAVRRLRDVRLADARRGRRQGGEPRGAAGRWVSASPMGWC